MTVKRNVCQTACWNAGFPHSRLKFSRPTHLPCSPVVAFVKLSQTARASGPPTSAVTNTTAGEMRTDASTPGRSKTFVQRLPRGRAAARASTRPTPTLMVCGCKHGRDQARAADEGLRGWDPRGLG